MAMPPPCGVGTVWLDRAFGRARGVALQQRPQQHDQPGGEPGRQRDGEERGEISCGARPDATAAHAFPLRDGGRPRVDVVRAYHAPALPGAGQAGEGSACFWPQRPRDPLRPRTSTERWVGFRALVRAPCEGRAPPIRLWPTASPSSRPAASPSPVQEKPVAHPVPGPRGPDGSGWPDGRPPRGSHARPRGRGRARHPRRAGGGSHADDRALPLGR